MSIPKLQVAFRYNTILIHSYEDTMVNLRNIRFDICGSIFGKTTANIAIADT
jgi:hypothetical protein